MNRLPDDVRAEVLLDYLPEESFSVTLRGLHKHNAYHDLLGAEETAYGRLNLELARMSLYDSLPEFFFHVPDRFDMMQGPEMREQFHDEIRRQDEEKEAALAFFKPVDMGLLELKTKVFKSVLPLVSGNKVLLDLIGDRVSEKQRQNRFIMKALHFLPDAKNIRGDSLSLTLILRKIFSSENLTLEPIEEDCFMVDVSPRYDDSVDGLVGDVYAGNKYNTLVHGYRLFYWSDDDCDALFQQFLEEVEMFRLFIQDWFMSVEEVLDIHLEKGNSATILSDNTFNSYLNYNTNLL